MLSEWLLYFYSLDCSQVYQVWIYICQSAVSEVRRDASRDISVCLYKRETMEIYGFFYSDILQRFVSVVKICQVCLLPHRLRMSHYNILIV